MHVQPQPASPSMERKSGGKLESCLYITYSIQSGGTDQKWCGPPYIFLAIPQKGADTSDTTLLTSETCHFFILPTRNPSDKLCGCEGFNSAPPLHLEDLDTQLRAVLHKAVMPFCLPHAQRRSWDLKIFKAFNVIKCYRSRDSSSQEPKLKQWRLYFSLPVKGFYLSCCAAKFSAN